MATAIDIRPSRIFSRQKSPKGHEAPQPKWTRLYRVRQLLSPLKVPTNGPEEVEATNFPSAFLSEIAAPEPAIATIERRPSNVRNISRASSPFIPSLLSHQTGTHDSEDGEAERQHAEASSNDKGKAAVPRGQDITIPLKGSGPQYLGALEDRETPVWLGDFGSGRAPSSAADKRNSASEGDSGYGSSSLPEHDLNVVDSGNELQQPKNGHLFAQNETSTSTSGSNPSIVITHEKPSRLGTRNPYRRPSQFDANAEISQAPIDEIKPSPIGTAIPHKFGQYPAISPNENPSSDSVKALTTANRLATNVSRPPRQGILNSNPHAMIESDAAENVIYPSGKARSSTNGTSSWLNVGNIAPLEAGASATLTSTTESVLPRCSIIECLKCDTTRVERLSRGCYMAPCAGMPNAIVQEWNQSVKPQLDQVLQELMKSNDAKREVVLTSVQLCMAGNKKGGLLYAKPTIVITCGTKSCAKTFDKRLKKLNLQYLIKFGAPIKTRFHPSPSYWAASTINATTSGAFSLNLRELIIDNLHGAALDSGAEMTFIISRGGEQREVRSTLGGILYIDGAFYAMTTAHTFLAKEDDDRKGQHKWTKPAGNHQGRTIRLSGSELLNRLAYSFLGQEAGINSVFDVTASTVSDWALVAIPEWTICSCFKCVLASRGTFHLTSVKSQSQLVSGKVEILCRYQGVTGKYYNLTGFLTQPNVSLNTEDKAMNVREIALVTPLPKSASGSWVVRRDELYGYIVACTKSRFSAYMVPMESAFRDIEAVFDRRLVFGRELVDYLERLEIQELERIGPFSSQSPSPVTPDVTAGLLKPKSCDKLQSYYEDDQIRSIPDHHSAAENVNEKANPYEEPEQSAAEMAEPRYAIANSFLHEFAVRPRFGFMRSVVKCCMPREAN